LQVWVDLPKLPPVGTADDTYVNIGSQGDPEFQKLMKIFQIDDWAEVIQNTTGGVMFSALKMRKQDKKFRLPPKKYSRRNSRLSSMIQLGNSAKSDRFLKPRQTNPSLSPESAGDDSVKAVYNFRLDSEANKRETDTNDENHSRSSLPN